MYLEVKVALNFIVSYLYDKLPRRRADMFREELERLLVSRFEGHWYPETPLRGSAFRCLHLGIPRDPLIDLAAMRSGLDTAEVRANVPPELSVWIDPYEVSYQIGENGEVKVLYSKDPPVQGSDILNADDGVFGGTMDKTQLDNWSLRFNPKAQMVVPDGGEVSPINMRSLPGSPQHSSPHQNLFGYFGPSTPTNRTIHSSNGSTPSPPTIGLNFGHTQQQLPVASDSCQSPQPVAFTTASFAATKFGSTKMKCGGPASATGSGILPQPMPSRSPITVPHGGLLKQKPLSLHTFGSLISSQLSPNAKEFIYPVPPRGFSFDSDAPPLPAHVNVPHPNPVQNHICSSFGLFSSPKSGHSVGVVSGRGGVSYLEKPTFMDEISGYNLQYPSHTSQPVVLAS